MINTYVVEIRSLETDVTKENEIHFFVRLRSENLERSIRTINLMPMFQKRGIKYERIVGLVMDFYPDQCYAILGHEGSDCGNIKTVEQFEISWKEI